MIQRDETKPDFGRTFIIGENLKDEPQYLRKGYVPDDPALDVEIQEKLTKKKKTEK